MGQGQISTRFRTTGRFSTLLVLVVLMVTGCAARTGTPGPPSTSDAQIEAAMAQNIADFPSISAMVHHNPDGQPDIAVRDAILIVAVLVPQGPLADQLCRSIAAITNNPNTAKPLGVRAITLIAGKDALANCRP
jgi:hypothetical protein